MRFSINRQAIEFARFRDVFETYVAAVRLAV
jgi:hypothetical protein